MWMSKPGATGFNHVGRKWGEFARFQEGKASRLLYLNRNESKENPMMQFHEGQCGMCAHYGENHGEEAAKLVQIRTSHEAPAELVEECGHPRHAPLHLKVTAVSGCDGFEPASPTERQTLA